VVKFISVCQNLESSIFSFVQIANENELLCLFLLPHFCLFTCGD
jgi:hypothetical protein